MAIDRRTLLFGAGFGVLAATTASPAHACFRTILSALDRRFWTNLWAAKVSAPREERRLMERLVSAVSNGSIDELNALFTPDARIFTAADGIPHWSRASSELTRKEGIEKLSKYVSRKGERSHRIDHQARFHTKFLLHAQMEGYGEPFRHDGKRVWLPQPGDGSCFEGDPHEWKRELLVLYRVEPVPAGSPLRIESLLWLT